MQRFLLTFLLVILVALLACTEATLAPTHTPSPTASPTETPIPTATPTQRSMAAPMGTLARTPAPKTTSTPEPPTVVPAQELETPTHEPTPIPTSTGLQPTPTPTKETVRIPPDSGNYPRVGRLNTVVKWPTSNVLIPVLWLGCFHEGKIVPAGSGVAIQLGGAEYMVTALHLAKLCGMNPLVRSNNQWNAITWEIVATSEADDIAVLKTDPVLDEWKISVRHGKVEGERYGQIGFALGYPTVFGEHGRETSHIPEVQGRPIPVVALAVSNFAETAKGIYSSSYINDGFSGGAIVFPVGTDDWTIAGIITGFPYFPRPVYRDGETTGDYIRQHSGLVVFTPLERVEELINESTGKGG